MIRKFSITNSTQLLTAEEQQQLNALSNGRLSRTGSDFTSSSQRDQGELLRDLDSDLQCTSTRSTETGDSILYGKSHKEESDYENLYMLQLKHAAVNGKK